MTATITDIFQQPDYAKLFNRAYLDTIVARPKGEQAREETLVQHSKTTLDVFDKIVDELGLKPVFEKLLKEAFGNTDEKYWHLLCAIVYFHDFGKINTAFQDRMKEGGKKSHESDHSLPGLFLFGTLLETYMKNEKDTAKSTAFYLASAIARHHTCLESPAEISHKIDRLWESEFKKKLLNEMFQKAKENGQAHLLGLWFNPTIQSPASCPGAIFRHMQEKLPDDPEQREAIFYLHKLLYSCLVSSDYYAAHYGEDVPSEITNTLQDISTLKTKLDAFIAGKQTDEEVSKARKKFREHAHTELKKNTGKNVFYLYLPTGGGKTLTSLSLALELAKENKSKRLFYVFPFVNIIEQNQKVLGEALGEELVSPIYSYSDWSLKDSEDDETHFINQEFTNYPVVVLSNVNFFHALIKSGKSSNYKLHNFANSVIVIDEIQSLNAKEWTLYNDLITNAAKMLNSKIIVMSASIPPIHKLTENEDLVENKISILIEPDTAELKAEFEKFWARVNLVLEKDEKEKIAEKCLVELAEEKINAHNCPDKVLIVANTIKKSLNAYSELCTNKDLKKEYEVLLLNSTMLPSRRQEIIEKIGQEKPDKKLILVSTQSVEAGLDVDFDLGIRELAPLDNLLQVCGRVNRNMKKGKNCCVYVATKDTSKDAMVYGELRFRGELKEDKKYGKKPKDNMQEKIKEIIGKEGDMDNKYGEYSQTLIAHIQKQNVDIYQENQRHSVESLRDLDFESLNEHNVIEQPSVSIFIPINIDLSKKDRLRELAKNLEIDEVDGKLPWKTIYELYIYTCKSKDRKKNIKLKKLAPLLNQFVISISHNRAHKLNLYVEEVFPGEGQRKYSSFLKLMEKEIGDEKIYTLENGLRIDKLKDNEDAVVF